MQTYNRLVRRLVKALKTAKLDYAFTGALAASFYGLPRTTTDVDVMVKVCDERARNKLINALARAGMRVDEREFDKAMASGYGVAELTDRKTAYSVDLILLTSKLQKRTGAIAGVQTFFQTPEDLILAKLRMIKATVPKERAQKDKDDIRAILKFTSVNLNATRKKAKKENTVSILEALISY
jgi:ribosomal protein S11